MGDQLRLKLRKPRTHGGSRRGAGRKAAGERAGVSHHGRVEVAGTAPVHVTLRVLEHVWNLRSRRGLRVVEGALAGMLGRRDFRVVHFSVQGNHVHFVVEADDNRALSEGVQGLSVRVAKGFNRMMGRTGKVLADRYHARVLATPTQVRHALAYVLLNHRSHMARAGERVGPGAPDPFSSAACFDGWADAADAPAAPTVTACPQTWLLKHGWKRAGLIRRDEIPADSR